MSGTPSFRARRYAVQLNVLSATVNTASGLNLYAASKTSAGICVDSTAISNCRTQREKRVLDKRTNAGWRLTSRLGTDGCSNLAEVATNKSKSSCSIKCRRMARHAPPFSEGGVHAK